MISLSMHGGPSHVDLSTPNPPGQSRGTEFRRRGCLQLCQPGGARGSSAPPGSSPATASAARCLSCCRRPPRRGRPVRGPVDAYRAQRARGFIRYFHGGLPAIAGRPTMGSWIVYGLGSESRSLPSYMVLADPDGHPVDGTINWSSAGSCPRSIKAPCCAPESRGSSTSTRPGGFAGMPQRQNLSFLDQLNRRISSSTLGKPTWNRDPQFRAGRGHEDGRQGSAHVSSEPAYIRQLYGLDDDATREYGTRLPDRPQAGRARRAVRAAFSRQPGVGSSHRRFNRFCRPSAAGHRPAAADLVRDLKRPVCWKPPSFTGAARSAACQSARGTSMPRPSALTTTARASLSGLQAAESRGRADVRLHRRGRPRRRARNIVTPKSRPRFCIRPRSHLPHCTHSGGREQRLRHGGHVVQQIVHTRLKEQERTTHDRESQCASSRGPWCPDQGWLLSPPACPHAAWAQGARRSSWWEWLPDRGQPGRQGHGANTGP